MTEKVRTISNEFWESDTAAGKLLTRTPFIRNFFALTQTMNALGLIYPELPKDQPEFGEILTAFQTVAAQNGAEVTLVYIPDRGRYEGVFKKGAAADYLRQEVLQTAAETNMEVVDLAEMFAAESNPNRFYAANNGHFGKEGAAFAAAAVARHADAGSQKRSSKLQVGSGK